MDINERDKNSVYGAPLDVKFKKDAYEIHFKLPESTDDGWKMDKHRPLKVIVIIKIIYGKIMSVCIGIETLCR